MSLIYIDVCHWSMMVCCRNPQQMLTGDIELVGNGMVRDVYFANYFGKKVVVKTLRHVNGLEAQKRQLGMHRREVVTLDAVSGAAIIASYFSRVV